MSTLEIVHLRSSAEPIESLIDRIRESIWSEEKGAGIVSMYRRYGLETDVAIQIRHRGGTSDKGPSPLAFNLASALKAFGLVEHTVWEEIK